MTFTTEQYVTIMSEKIKKNIRFITPNKNDVINDFMNISWK